mmetsp:Transcript_10460/g.13091  ORF Transcript_10460/g.13091 Transcript_10460/m.13091 type:complete len:163 (+) Transcript_10460:76-564(+)
MSSWYCAECGFENLDKNSERCELCQCDRRDVGEDEPLVNGRNMEEEPGTPDSFAESGTKSVMNTPHRHLKEDEIPLESPEIWHDAQEGEINKDEDDDDELIVLRKSSPPNSKMEENELSNALTQQKNKRGAETLVSASPKTYKKNDKENLEPSINNKKNLRR